MAKRLGDMIAFRLTIVVTITGWVSSHSLSVVPSHIKPFIVGGSEADPNEFPWQVSVQSGLNFHICGGVILDPKTVLTTAACADIVSPYDFKILAGKHNLTANETSSQSVQIISKHLHPDFPGDSEYSNDIAILKLSNAITWSEYVAPIPKLHETYSIDETVGMISGWGTKQEGHISYSETLQKATIQIISNPECQVQVDSQLVIEDTMVCIASFPNSTEPVDSCSGDEGGPLIIQENGETVLVGLISFGIGCGRSNLPSFCTRVSPYIDFIRQYLED